MSQTVVITGIAQGMGRSVALRLAKAGDRLAGFDVDAEGIARLRDDLDGLGCEHLLTTLDITDRPGITQFRDDVLAKFGAPDTVLSNVGIGFFGAFEEVDLDGALKCMDINVIGTAAIFQAFVPAMRERRSGKLIAMSSLVGEVPFPFESIYSASKFAVEGLVQSFKLELRPFGIQVSIVQPAQVSTTFAAKIHKLPPESSPYYDRIRRFIERDDELIKSAPDPERAAQKIVDVIRAPAPPLKVRLDFMSSFFITLNRFLPVGLRDAILVRHMDIRP